MRGSGFWAFSAWKKSCSCPKLRTQPALPFIQPPKESKKLRHYTTLCNTILHDVVWKYAIARGHPTSVEPKVRLEGYGYDRFCSHSSRCLAVLVWQYFEEAFCAPKVRLKRHGFKGFPSHSSHCSGGLFPQYSGVSPQLPFATTTLPTRKNDFRIIFRLPFHDFDFFELILENCPIPIAFVWVVWYYPVGTPVLVELFFIAVTRFEVFRINWVMFSWQIRPKFRTQPVDRSTPKLLRSFPAIHSIWSKHPNILKRTLEVFVQLLTFVCLHGCHHGGFLSSFFIGQMCHGSGLPRLSLIALNAWFGRLWNALFTTCLQFMWLAFGLKRTPQNHYSTPPLSLQREGLPEHFVSANCAFHANLKNFRSDSNLNSWWELFAATAMWWPYAANTV